MLARYPQDRLLVVALSNYVTGAPGRLESELAGQYFYDTNSQAPAAKLTAKALDAYTGKFRSGNAIITIARQGKDLSLENTGLAQEKPSPAHRMLALSQTDFVLAPLETKVVFTRDAAGAVTALAISQTGNQAGQNGAALTASRTSQAEIDKSKAALADRVKANIASPEAEAALRRIIAGIQAGTPPYEELSPPLANITRMQMPTFGPTFKGWGAPQTVTFKSVGPAGADIYEVQFENAKVEWRIAPPVEGKVSLLNFRPL